MNLFKGFKVRSKIIIACATLISMTLIVTVQSIRSNNIANENFEEFYNDRFIPVKQLSKIMMNLLQIRINTLISLIEAKNGNWVEVEKRDESSIQLAGEYSSLWKEFGSTKMTDVEKKLADEWVELAKKPREIRALYMQKLKEKDFKSAEIHLADWLTAFRPLRDKTEELIILQQNEGEKINSHIVAISNQNMTLTIIILVASLIAGSLISFFLSRGIMQQLGGEPEDVMIIAGKVASGDLTVEVSVKEGDTKSAMSALKKMVDGLETLISGIISSSQNLAQAVEQISEGNQNMSQRTSEQASSLEEIAATTEEAAASINQNFQYALEAKTVSEGYANLAKSGGILVMEAVSAMNEIDQTSSKISEITTAINEIAFQTNLLALNAAVEAARAGDQGRGFAVVAGEVRNLAQRAGVSAKDIGKLIQLSLEKIQIGTEKVNKSGEALKEMMSAAEKVSSMVSEITASSNEQKQGIEQINKAITDMDTMTQQNAALVEEIASGSEEMSSQAQELVSGASVFTLKEVSRSNFSGGKIEEKKYFHLGKTQSVNTSIKGNVLGKTDNKLSKKNNFNNVESSFHVNELLADEGFEKF